MSKNTVIKVENLGKKYTIGEKQKYLSLRDSLAGIVTKPINFLAGKREKPNEFWALKDVNFEINQGEVVGVIGKNGAGKSTLLKILSRITEPTTGKVTLKGRVASMLEVGTGFHQELTGRENIYLNGSILGMTRKEIKRKFDDIVDFSGVQKFIDTPVKRYSSGMYVRLAFSVSAYLEPDILVVDEVLSVGDSEFQKKSIGKMDEVSKNEGRTILFVSHNMNAIKSLCSRCILLDEGTIVKQGETNEVIKNYLSSKEKLTKTNLQDRKDRTGKGTIRINQIEISNQEDKRELKSGDDIFIKIGLSNRYLKDVKARLALSIRTEDEYGLISCDSIIKEKLHIIKASKTPVIKCKISSLNLSEGNYYLNVGIFVKGEAEDWIHNATKFFIKQEHFLDHKRVVPFPILTDFEWETE